MPWEQYLIPESPEEAVQMLHQQQGAAQILAGGTDLLVQLRNKKTTCKTLVDISRLESLKTIEEKDSFIRVGALVTHKQILSSPLIQQKSRALAEAANSIGSPQIRNVATIGGNVVNALPAADTSIALMALGARLCILNLNGKKEIPVEEAYLGPGQSCVDSSREVVTSFIFQSPGPRETTIFYRLSRRKALCLPTLNLALWISMDESATVIRRIRVALGPVARVPYRAKKTEEFLSGERISKDTFKQAAKILVADITPRDSLRGSATYKKEMAGMFFIKAISSAVAELRGE